MIMIICNWITETSHQFNLCLASVEQKTLVVHRVVSLWNCEVCEICGVCEIFESVRLWGLLDLCLLWDFEYVRLWGLWCLRWMWGCEVVSLQVYEVFESVRLVQFLWGLWCRETVRFVRFVGLWVHVCEDYESVMLWDCESAGLKVCMLPTCPPVCVCHNVRNTQLSKICVSNDN